MLSYKKRFHGHGSMRYLYSNGSSIRSQKIVLRYIVNSRRKQSRFAVVVSKKVMKTAVGRNRIRRRIYEIIRQEFNRIDGVYDVAIIVFHKSVKDMPYDELRNQVVDMFKEADLYCNK